MKMIKFLGALLTTVAWVTVSAPSSPRPLTEELWVDLIEVNHIYDKRGEYSFSQIIYWREYPTVGLNRSCLAAVGFQLLTKDSPIGTWPSKTTRGYEQTRVIPLPRCEKRVVIASKYYRESHTQVDPERESKRLFWKNQEVPDILADFAPPKPWK